MNPIIRNSLGIVGCMVLVCLCVALICLSSALVSVDDTAAATTLAVNSANLAVDEVGKQLIAKNGLINELTSTARESRKTIDVLQATSLAERAKVAAFSDASIQAVNDLDVVARNGATAVLGLQEATAGLGHLAASLKSDSDAAGQTITGATALLSTLSAGAGQSLAGVNSAVSHVDDLVVSAKPAVQHVDHLTEELDGSGKSLEETLGFIRDDFKPQKKSFWINLLDKATNGLVSVAVSWLFPEKVVIAK